MASKTCRVTITDLDGVEHTALVSAETLFEAVARGLVAISQHAWAEELVQGSVRVSVQDTPVEHSVKLRQFRDWLARTGGAPRDITARQRIQAILSTEKRLKQ
jgi:hypothetical protein